jgi:hypothetical protein
LPTDIRVIAGSETAPARVIVEWRDTAIMNRWLQIKLLANSNTGLREPQVYYIGHLLGETTGTLSTGVYVVQVADLTPIRSAVGTTALVSSAIDLNKNGLIQVNDITAMRARVGVGQLRNITIPPAGSGGEGEGGLGGNGWMQQAPLPEASTSASRGQVRIEPRLAEHRYDVLPLDESMPTANSASSPRYDSSEVSFASPTLKRRNATSDLVDLETPLDVEAIDAAFASM